MVNIAEKYGLVVQGNLDPAYLTINHLKDHLGKLRALKDTLRQLPAIFNLGHGLLPETKIDNVELLIAEISS